MSILIKVNRNEVSLYVTLAGIVYRRMVFFFFSLFEVFILDLIDIPRFDREEGNFLLSKIFKLESAIIFRFFLPDKSVEDHDDKFGEACPPKFVLAGFQTSRRSIEENRNQQPAEIVSEN